jgi:hypothetical protein
MKKMTLSVPLHRGKTGKCGLVESPPMQGDLEGPPPRFLLEEHNKVFLLRIGEKTHY